MAHQKVFISYGRQDSEKTRGIATQLRQLGVDCILDLDTESFGVEYTSKLASDIKGSDAVIFLVSQSSLRSQWCRREIEFAYNQRKRIIPILINPPDQSAFQDSWLPEEVKSKSTILFTDNWIKSLLKAVEQEVSVAASQGKSTKFSALSTLQPTRYCKPKFYKRVVGIIIFTTILFLASLFTLLLQKDNSGLEANPCPETTYPTADTEYVVDSTAAPDILYAVEDSMVEELPITPEPQPADTPTPDTSAVATVQPSPETNEPTIVEDKPTSTEGSGSYWWLLSTVVCIGLIVYYIYLQQKMSVKFIANEDCELYVDNEEKGAAATLKKNRSAIVSLPRGEYNFIFKPTNEKIAEKTLIRKISKAGELIEMKFPTSRPEEHRVIKCFIAGSTHLEAERDALRAAISRTNNEWEKMNIEVLAYTFEDFDRQMVVGGQQNKYNEFLEREATIAAFVINENMGTKTKEEFQIANNAFKSQRHPEIIIFNSDSSPKNDDTKELEKIIINEKQYWVDYSDIKDLRHEFMATLNRIILNNYF